MIDWKEIKRSFREALLTAFNQAGLALVLAYHCDRRLDHISSEKVDFEKNVDDVISDAVRNGWLEELARGALAENETHTGLQATVPQILQGVAAEGKAYYQRPTAGGGSGRAAAGAGAQAGGDITTVGNISNASGVAIGRDAKVYQGDVHYHYETPAEQEKPRLEYEPQMVAIPAGVFLMGSDQGHPEEAPQHQVELDAYAIGRFPVTNEQFARFISDTPRTASLAMLWDGNRPPEDRLNYPVTGVTWYEALAYCQWLEEKTGKLYRLPNEAQWEKAARGEEGFIYPWGNEWEEGRCNTGGDFTAVDAFPQQNEYGCYDMVGNAREWTLTAWGRDPRTPDRLFAYKWKADRRNNPDEPSTTRRVYRGGRVDVPFGYRCSARGGYLPKRPGLRSNRHGFRVVIV